MMFCCVVSASKCVIRVLPLILYCLYCLYSHSLSNMARLKGKLPPTNNQRLAYHILCSSQARAAATALRRRRPQSPRCDDSWCHHSRRGTTCCGRCHCHQRHHHRHCPQQPWCDSLAAAASPSSASMMNPGKNLFILIFIRFNLYDFV